MGVRTSHTAVIERNAVWQGEFATDPYEAAWAGEAIFFIRALADGPGGTARVQLSPDGIFWCDEGTQVTLATEADGVTFCRVRQFGGWLRLAGKTTNNQPALVLVYLTLKE
jgi:hypothetical protein